MGPFPHEVVILTPAQFLFLIKEKFWACRIPVPGPGIEPEPLAVRARSPNHWTPREAPALHIFCAEQPWAGRAGSQSPGCCPNGASWLFFLPSEFTMFLFLSSKVNMKALLFSLA